MSIRTLYIAGPMTGMPDMNYPEFFDIQSKLEAQGYRVLNPARVDVEFPKACGHSRLDAGCTPCMERDWMWYMRRTINMMLEADGVALLRGWRNSRGAKIEHDLALALGMPVNMWQAWSLRAIEARTPSQPDKPKRDQSIIIIHMDELGIPFCGTRGRPRWPMTPNWEQVNCKRCISKRGKGESS